VIGSSLFPRTYNLFHVEQVWRSIIDSSRGVPTNHQIELLTRYRDWLADEAIPGGGMGPAETARLDTRHIADSLLFLLALPDVTEVLDIGSGVGLPGIPLAIAAPRSRFTLLDRSQRRCDLMRRAVRVLDLENIQVVEGDLAGWHQKVPAVVTRASLPPDRLRAELDRVLQPGGIGLVGGSWVDAPDHAGFSTKEVGSKILDQPVWILMMRHT